MRRLPHNNPLPCQVMQLRADVCPVTAENFRLLVTEELGYGFRMTRFHKVNEPDGLYGGDFMSGTGDDSVSVFACTSCSAHVFATAFA